MPMEHAADRRAAFWQAAQQQGLGGAVVADPRHVYYLTGWQPTPLRPAYLVFDETGRATLVAPAGTPVAGVAVEEYLGYSIQEVFPAVPRSLEALARVRPGGSKPLGVESAVLTTAAAAAAVGNRETADITPLLQRLRLRKWPDELALIMEAAKQADAGYAAAELALRAGADEFELYLHARQAVEATAGEMLAFDGDFVSGERTLLHGGPPTHRQPRAGDTVILDLFPTYRGYWADTCRTFTVASPTAAQLALGERVLEALEAGRQAIRPGLRANELYETVRQALGRHGDSSSFTHHGGHGIGLWPHEGPMVIPADDTELAEGMVVTLEPGLYLPDVGGVRYEDDYVVTAGGCATISAAPKRLFPPA